MLGVNYQTIYCNVKKCRHNEKHETLDGKTEKVVETYYICKAEYIYLDKNGKCKEA